MPTAVTNETNSVLPPPRWPSTLPAETKLQKHVLRPHRTRTIAVLDALQSTGLEHHDRWAHRLGACCRTGFLHVHPDTGHTRPWFLKCRSRLCPFCGKGRSAQVADAIHAIVDAMEHPKHVTLTYRSRPHSLRQQLRDMRRALAQLRRHPEWKRRVAGGVYTVEITRNAQTGLWHPHLHLLIDSAYFPQPLLARLWGEVMEGGENVWIRQVLNSRNAAWEISKYVGKPPPAESWPIPATVAYAEAVHGMRMLQTFGASHGKRLPDENPHPDVKPQGKYISIPALAYMANCGEPVAMDLAALCWSAFPRLRTYLEDVCPAATQADALQTNPVLRCPRPPLLRPGDYGPLLDPADQASLETALDLTTLLWFGMVDAGEIDPLRAYTPTRM